ncbi:MAG: GyrI-like domain-containing protein [Erysipelotrichaceae bacterium]
MSVTYEVVETEKASILMVHEVIAFAELKQTLGKAFAQLYQYMGMHQIEALSAPFARYLQFSETGVALDIGIVVADSIKGEGAILNSSIPKGMWAQATYVGPYSGLSEEYAAFEQWMSAQGYTHGAIAYEWYLNDPQRVPASELITQIRFEIEKRP